MYVNIYYFKHFFFKWNIIFFPTLSISFLLTWSWRYRPATIFEKFAFVLHFLGMRILFPKLYSSVLRQLQCSLRCALKFRKLFSSLKNILMSEPTFGIAVMIQISFYNFIFFRFLCIIPSCYIYISFHIPFSVFKKDVNEMMQRGWTAY